MNETQAQLVKVIQKLRLFQGFELEDMQRLLPICQFTTYETDKKIYKVGEPSREMLVLLMGKLHVLGNSGEVLAEILPGASVGEMGVFTGEPRSADIVAAEKSTGFVIGKPDLEKLLRTHKDLYFTILQNLVSVISERLIEANRLNNEHVQTIMKMQDQLVRYTGKTARELEEDENA